MSRVYIVRHGETEGNNSGRFQGNSDTELSALGLAQIEALNKRFYNVHISHIYTSPLKRAQITAQGIKLTCPISAAPELREIHLGSWEGVHYDAVAERWPREKQIWNDEPHLFAAPNGESMQQVYDRVTAFIERVEAQGDILLVSHGGTIRNVMAWLSGGIHTLKDMPWVKNTSVTCYEYSGGVRNVVLTNDVSHIL